MKISICIPTFNQAQYLKQAVLSTYNQSIKPFEIIVSDDCSTDNTREVLTMLSAEIPVLKVIFQPVNIGMVNNTDACLRSGSGDYIVGLDSDDYLAPNYLEKLSGLLEKFPEAGYAHADVQEIDQDGNFRQLRKLFRKPGFQSGEIALHSARKGYRVAANIIMFRRCHLIKLNYFSGRPDYIKDYHLAAEIAAFGLGNVYLNETLSFYRVWVDKNKTRKRRKLAEIVGCHKVFIEVLEPAYKERGWNLSKLNQRRNAYACQLADCLGWDNFSNKEKKELSTALTNLSTSRKVKLYVWVYMNGFGKFVDFQRNIKLIVRLKIKALVVGLRNLNLTEP